VLSEIKNPRQVTGEPHRRWFTDEYFDLIVWEDPIGSVVAFQLCYDKGPHEKALTWGEVSGFEHRGIDDGENRVQHHKMTPILIPDGEFEREPILNRFLQESGQIDNTIRNFVIQKLNQY